MKWEKEGFLGKVRKEASKMGDPKVDSVGSNVGMVVSFIHSLHYSSVHPKSL